MNRRATFLVAPVATAVVLLAVIVLVACDSSQKATPAPAAAASLPATQQVLVVFEGPWAIVNDPKNANSVLALAPKTKVHNDLYVAASNDSSLAAGTYDLSVPAHGPAYAGALDPTFAQVKIDARSLQHALDDKSNRYVVRLPKPEAYVAARRYLSRVGSSYPPDPSTEQNYVTFVSFRYSVSTLNGFSLAGTPDTGTFNPLLLQLDSPSIRFAIEQPDAPPDACHNHSRGAFRDTVKFLGLKLYVDFPNDSPDCHKTDPQVSGAAKTAGRFSPRGQLAALLLGDRLQVQDAQAPLDSQISFAGPTPPPDLMTALYLFHASDGGCKSPLLFLTITP